MADTFGERLQNLRTGRDLTLEDLAEAIGSTKSYVWELENKPNIRPSAELVYKLAVALDTTVGVLMGEAAPDELPQEAEVFFRKYQKLGDKTKERLGALLDALDEEDG